MIRNFTLALLTNSEEVKIVDRTLKDILDRSGETIDLRRTDLSCVNFIEADLREANLRRANLSKADLSKADLSGSDLSWANLREVDLSGANLRGADLIGTNLREADLREADLRGADLRGADLSGADLSGANLNNAKLSNTNLSNTILTNIKLLKSLNLSQYKIPNLDQKVADLVGNGENLDMELYHSSCGTQHCRAGYAVLAAEAAGKNLEDEIGTSAAAALIYHASTGCVPDFFASYNNALADIRKCAEK